MNILEPSLHLRISGVLLIALALFHIALPRRFGWREELQTVSLFTRQVFHGHMFFIALTVGLMGALALFLPGELLRPSPLAKGVLLGLVAFWTCRLFFQLFIYDAALWRGKAFETRVHVLFSVFCLYLIVAFGLALWRQFIF